MVSNEKLANAVGGKTARACDSCIRNRARWYCAADDAFLCQSCDSSVHSANSLARRHQRVCLKTASSSENSAPTWHKGFTKKARTPRNSKKTTYNQNLKSEQRKNTLSSDPLVPEFGNGDGENSNYEDQLVYRVPTLDPFETSGDHGNNLHGLFVPSEMELAEFAADVENLLGFEEDSFDIEGLGLLERSEERDLGEGCLDGERVKVEDDEEGNVMENVHGFDMEMEPFEFNFDYDSSAVCEEEEANIKVENTEGEGGEIGDGKKKMKKTKNLLRLDCEGVMMAWDSQKSPWTGGERPELDPSDCWPHCMGSCGSIHGDLHGGMIGGGIGGGYSALMMDGGREARVSRYREKRRTRLFSKKIRYEVRKLNAEKRPRMKGRFVKRVSTFAGPAAFPLQTG